MMVLPLFHTRLFRSMLNACVCSPRNILQVGQIKMIGGMILCWKAFPPPLITPLISALFNVSN